MDAMTACQYCRGAIQPGTRKCPHCHQWLGAARWLLYLWPVIFFPFMLFPLMSLWLERPGREANFEDYREQLHIVETTMHYEADERFPTITTLGKLRNDSAIPWRWFEIEVQYFNASGELIDVASDSLARTALPGETISFRVRQDANKPEDSYASQEIVITMARDGSDRL